MQSMCLMRWGVVGQTTRQFNRTGLWFKESENKGRASVAGACSSYGRGSTVITTITVKLLGKLHVRTESRL